MTLKVVVFPSKTEKYQNMAHPTVLTHGDVQLFEKYSFSQGNRHKSDQKMAVLWANS